MRRLGKQDPDRLHSRRAWTKVTRYVRVFLFELIKDGYCMLVDILEMRRRSQLRRMKVNLCSNLRR